MNMKPVFTDREPVFISQDLLDLMEKYKISFSIRVIKDGGLVRFAAPDNKGNDDNELLLSLRWNKALPMWRAISQGIYELANRLEARENKVESGEV